MGVDMQKRLIKLHTSKVIYKGNQQGIEKDGTGEGQFS